MNLKSGDKVRLKKNSNISNIGNKFNPLNTNGIIIVSKLTKLVKSTHRYKIKWDNGVTNGFYGDDEIEHWYIEPVKELFKKVISPYSGSIQLYLKHLIEDENPLTDEQLDRCRYWWGYYS
ncbi:hypothetical protein COB55_03955 [Candidatus Wolfebacteria bacterium]|nr:MAG: hypothetical protein COB55_03955 [Candidatus Wolfebacteria bacterium]